MHLKSATCVSPGKDTGDTIPCAMEVSKLNEKPSAMDVDGVADGANHKTNEVNPLTDESANGLSPQPPSSIDMNNYNTNGSSAGSMVEDSGFLGDVPTVTSGSPTPETIETLDEHSSASASDCSSMSEQGSHAGVLGKDGSTGSNLSQSAETCDKPAEQSLSDSNQPSKKEPAETEANSHSEDGEAAEEDNSSEPTSLLNGATQQDVGVTSAAGNAEDSESISQLTNENSKLSQPAAMEISESNNDADGTNQLLSSTDETIQTTTKTHDDPSGSHDDPSGSHDDPSGSHDDPSGSHDDPSGSHETSDSMQLSAKGGESSQSGEGVCDTSQSGDSACDTSQSGSTDEASRSMNDPDQTSQLDTTSKDEQAPADAIKPSQSTSESPSTSQSTAETATTSQSTATTSQSTAETATTSQSTNMDSTTGGTSSDTVKAGQSLLKSSASKISEDQNVKGGEKSTDKPKETAFNVKPSTVGLTTGTKQDAPSPQDIKDGHAFLRPMPKFLYQLGLSLLREVVYEGLAEHVGNLRKKGDKKYSEEQFQSLQKSLNNLKKDNQHLAIKPDKVCKAEIDGRRCGFQTESELAMETHRSTTHVSRSNRYVCARCGASTPHISNFRNHMMDKHALEAIIDKQMAFFPCKLCLYEINSSARLQAHMVNCAKSFKLNHNLTPHSQSLTPLDEGIFRTVAPKQVSTVMLKNTVPGVKNVTPTVYNIVQSKPSNQMQHLASIKPAVAGAGTLQQIKINSQIVHSTKPSAVVPKGVVTSGAQSTVTTAAPKSDVMPCEICNGFIQGLQALRVHMQWCHNINITQWNKAEFQCTTCYKFFWTVQGMAKHSSTCVSSSPVVTVPDNATNCFICCKPYFTSQVEHLLAKHLSDLKHMVEIKKCLAPKCSPFLFGSVENLQFHLAKEHRLKMTGLAGLATANVSNIKFQPFCSICKLKFSSSTDFAKHCAEKHVHKCDLCGAQCSTQHGLKEHEAVVHPFRFCLACNKQIKRSHYGIHLFSMHNADKCRIHLKRISDDDYKMYSKKSKLENWS